MTAFLQAPRKLSGEQDGQGPLCKGRAPQNQVNASSTRLGFIVQTCTKTFPRWP
jgi:hypothetical protein